MSIATFGKYLLGVWGVPIAISITALVISPDPGKPKSDHPAVTFTPAKVEVQQGRGRKGSDFFELWLHHPDGTSYHHRDPEQAPIVALEQRVPKGVPLLVTFTPDSEGNVLLGIDRIDNGEAILSYDAVMAEYASRRTLVFTIAAIWLVLGNLLAWGLYRALPLPKRDP